MYLLMQWNFLIFSSILGIFSANQAARISISNRYRTYNNSMCEFIYLMLRYPFQKYLKLTSINLTLDDKLCSTSSLQYKTHSFFIRYLSGHVNYYCGFLLKYTCIQQVLKKTYSDAHDCIIIIIAPLIMRILRRCLKHR